jgi:CHAT domain-containing protein
MVSSYTPTLAALVRAQQDAPIVHIPISKFVVIAAERPQDQTLSTLWNVKEEISRVVESAETARMSVDKALCMSASASTTEVGDQPQSAEFIHVACHGIQDPKAPLKSRFCVSDGNVSVQELMNLRLKNAFLAFLSACETAKGDQKQPDQAIHLAATMLFVGFKSVIATLWYVHRKIRAVSCQ